MAETRTRDPDTDKPVPIVVDCDNTLGLAHREIDDGLALLTLLSSRSVSVCAVTTTFGNGTMEEVFGATCRLLARVGRRDIPVHRGAPGPGPHSTAAARELVRLADLHGGRLIVLAIGSMTNLYAAATLDSGFFGKLHSVYVMGGYLGSLRFARREVAELNLSADPTAAFAVLNAPCPVTLMNAQLCLGARFGVRHLPMIILLPGWLRKAVFDWFVSFSRAVGRLGFYLWDLVPTAAILDPCRFPENHVRCVSTVEQLSRGELHTHRERPIGQAGNAAGRSATGEHEPGVINMPARIRRSLRFAADLMKTWRHGARGR